MVFLWIFLPVTLLLGMIIRKPRYQNILLLIASLLFYAWGEPFYVLLLLFSVLMNWGFGLLIGRADGRKKLWLLLSVVCNLGLLSYYKYANFLLNTIDTLLPGIPVPRVYVELPIGISFFTFQAMSYVIDLYRGEYEAQKNPLSLALYISFFPQLIAGPIVKYREVQRALSDRTTTAADLAAGTRRFLYGLGKKVVLSNVLAYPTDRIFSYEVSQLSLPLAWAGCLLYGLQIYYDFSGYSDMAIGLGRMFGFRFPENFDLPYLSVSIREYWRRWHISLSSWFREYLYVPLGGNRRGPLRTYVNLVIVFAATGLWHGARWTFVIWGLYHGIFILLERAWIGKTMERIRPLGHLYMLLVVTVGWALFRPDGIGVSLALLTRMFVPGTGGAAQVPFFTVLTPKVLLFAAAGAIGAGVLQRGCELTETGRKLREKWRGSLAEAIFLLLLLCYALLLLANDTYNPFIYFRF